MLPRISDLVCLLLQHTISLRYSQHAHGIQESRISWCIDSVCGMLVFHMAGYFFVIIIHICLIRTHVSMLTHSPNACIEGMILTTQTALDAKVLDLAALVKHIFHEIGERFMVGFDTYSYRLPLSHAGDPRGVDRLLISNHPRLGLRSWLHSKATTTATQA